MAAASGSSLEDAVPDLFGSSISDSFGPAPGEFIDASLLDPAVPTVPPPGRALPVAPGVPAEALKVAPPSARSVKSKPAKAKRGGSRLWLAVPLLVLLLGAAGFAAWQAGLAGDEFDRLAASLGLGREPGDVPSERSTRRPTPTARPEKQNEEVPPARVIAEQAPSEPAEPTDDADQAATNAAAAAVPAPGVSMVKFQVLSVPTGAFVSVDGKNVGRTPLELEYAAGTEISLVSRARGYSPRKQQLTVQATQSAVKLMLAPLPYVVQVVTEPAGARVTAIGGGEVITPGELRFKSMSGPRQIVISKDGYKTITKSVVVSSFAEEGGRMATAMSLTLEKEPASAQAPPAAETNAQAPTSAGPAPQPEKPAAPAVDANTVEEKPEASETTGAEAP
jgi:hypothetical protein